MCPMRSFTGRMPALRLSGVPRGGWQGPGRGCGSAGAPSRPRAVETARCAPRWPSCSERRSCNRTSCKERPEAPRQGLRLAKQPSQQQTRLWWARAVQLRLFVGCGELRRGPLRRTLSSCLACWRPHGTETCRLERSTAPLPSHSGAVRKRRPRARRSWALPPARVGHLPRCSQRGRWRGLAETPPLHNWPLLGGCRRPAGSGQRPCSPASVGGATPQRRRGRQNRNRLPARALSRPCKLESRSW
mmetsp:Transcript_2764/g.11146  ORF Transcript_2764/g.11146 Transcript_2764/m.11146 type:complete len:245 (+) Transcript_2764:847-1581(+)